MRQAYESQLCEVNSSFALEKGFQSIFESLLQFILQSAILQSESESNPFSFGILSLLSVKTYDPVKTFQLLTSFGSVLVSFYRMLTTLKIQIGDQVINPNPIRSRYKLWLGYLLICGIFLRLLSFGCTFYIYTWSFATILFSIQLLLMVIPCGFYIWIISRKAQQEIKPILLLNCFSCILVPVLGIFEMNIIFICAIITNVLGFILPYSFMAINHAIQNVDNLDQEGYIRNSRSGLLPMITLYGVAFSFAGIFYSYAIENILKESNLSLKIEDTIKSKDLVTMKGIYLQPKPCTTKAVNYIMSGFGDGIKNTISHLSMTPFILATLHNSPEGVRLLLNKKHLNIPINYNAIAGKGRYDFKKILGLEKMKNQGEVILERMPNFGRIQINAKEIVSDADKAMLECFKEDKYFNKSAMMIAAMEKNVPIVDIMMTQSDQVDLDWNLTDHLGMTAFILACQPGSDHETEKVVRLFLKHSNVLNIDLNTHDNSNRSGFDYLPNRMIHNLIDQEIFC